MNSHPFSFAGLDHGANRITCPPEIAGGFEAAQQLHADAPQIDQLAQKFLKSGPQAQKIRFFPNLDKLKLGFYCSFSAGDREKLFKILDSAKKSAQENDSGIEPIDFGKYYDFLCFSQGKRGGFGYHISKDDVHIFFSKRENIEKTPNIYCEIGSKSCWAPGHLQVVSQLIDFINHVGGIIEKHKISETHLCCDAVGQKLQDLPIAGRENWVCRVQQVGHFQKYESLHGVNSVSLTDTGVCMGGKCSIHSVIYDKIYEGKRHPDKQAVFLDSWGESSWDEICVTRVEYHLRREILKQFKIDTYSELIENLGNLWTYLTEDWQRLVLGADRQNRHQDRAVLHPFWADLQKVVFGDGWTSDLVREQPPPSGDLEGLIKSAAGYAMSISTLLKVESNQIERCVDLFSSCIKKYLYSLFFDSAKVPIPGKEGVLVTKFEKKMLEKKSRLWPILTGLAAPLPSFVGVGS